MIQLPNGIYPVMVKIYDETDKVFNLKLSDEVFKLHINPFANSKTATYLEGEKEYLENYIVRNRISSYAFTPCKSYISCVFEEDFEVTEEMINEINKEELIERFKTIIISGRLEHIEQDELQKSANDMFDGADEEALKEMKKELIIHNKLSSMFFLVYPYHEALNKFIKQYSYSRNDVFVETITMHTLSGTYVQSFRDGNLVEQTKAAGKMSSIAPYDKWMNDIEENDLITLKERLINYFEIPPTRDLLIMARNLNERGEYRSAIINASAALEVAVEQKITEKMLNDGKTQSEIDRYLKITKTDFPRRCDEHLKEKTGKSLVADESSLWTLIKEHRSKYRHKIAHSSLMPGEKDSDKAVNDFEEAVNWVNSL